MNKIVVPQSSRIPINYQQFKIIRSNGKIVQSILQHRQTKKYFRSISYCIEEVSEREKAKIEREVQAYIKCSKKVGQSIKEYSIEDHSNITFLTKYSKKSLLSLLADDSRRNKETDEINAVSIMRELAQSLKQLHREGLTHNQISLQKIFIKEGKAILSLPYFSFIEKFQRNQCAIKPEQKIANLYIAPELVNGHCFSKSSDVWALGIIFLELLLGKHLNESIEGEDLQLVLCKFMNQIESSNFRFLIEQMLLIDANDRATVEQVLDHFMLKDAAARQNGQKNKTKVTFSLFNFFSLQPTKQINLTIGNHINLKFISQQSKQLRCYELLDSNNLLQALVLGISLTQFNGQLLQFPYFLSDIILSTKSHNLIANMSIFRDLVKKQSLAIKLTESGELVVIVSQEDLTECKDKFIPRKLQRVGRCVAKITNELGQTYQGLLISYDLVLTTSRAERSGFKQASGQSIVELRLNENSPPERALSFTFFEESESNCLILKLENILSRLRYITLTSNYSEQQTIKKLKKADKSINFHYQAGSSLTLFPNDIVFLHNGRFEVKFGSNVKVHLGCPLLIVFSFNQCYAIGLFDRQQGGALFGERFYWFMWSSLQNYCTSVGIGINNIFTRMIQWQHVNLSELEPFVLNSNVGQKEEEYFLDDTAIISKPLMQQTFALTQMKEECFSKNDLGAAQSYLKSLSSIYKQLYGPQSSQLALQSFVFGHLLYSSKLGSIEMVQQRLEYVFAQEQKNHHNILLSVWSLLGLGNYYSVQEGLCANDRLKERIIIDKIWSYLSRVRWMVEKIDSKSTTGAFNYLMGKYYLFKEHYTEAQLYFQKASDAQIDHLARIKVHLSAFNLCNILSHHLKALKYLARAFESERRNLFGSIQGKRDQIMQGWLELSGILLNRQQTTVEEIELLIELTQKYVEEKAADVVPIFQEKKRRVQNRL